MAKALPEITGFNIGCIMPLEQVGFIMKEVFDRGGKLDLVQPFAEMRQPTNGHKHLADTSGVSGLLPPPAGKLADQFSGKSLKNYLALQAALREGGAGGSRIRELVARLKKKRISDFIIRSLLKKMQAIGEVSQNPDGVWHGSELAVVASAPASGVPSLLPRHKIIVDFIVSRGHGGAGRKDIIKALNAAGHPIKNWYADLVERPISLGLIRRAATNVYVGVQSAQAASSPQPSIDDTRGMIVALLRDSGPHPRHEVVDYILSKKKMTKPSAKQTLRRMVADKELHESPTKMMSIPHS